MNAEATNDVTAKFQQQSRELYDIYEVQLTFREWVCGGTPRDPELIKKWVAARTGYEDEKTEVQTKEHLEVMAEGEAEKSWTGFPQDERGLFLWSRQVKAMFKESSTVLGIAKKKRGSKQILQHGFEVKGVDHAQRVYLDVTEPSGHEEGPVHVMTAQGPRTALKRFDYVEGATIAFEVWVLKTAAQEKRHLGEDDIVRMLSFAQENGLGANRSQGFGKFDVVAFNRTQ